MLPLSSHPTQAFITDDLQVADIIEFCIRQYGSDTIGLNIYQSTFSISEEFLRRIWHLKKNSSARFILVIDRKALHKTHQLWIFVSEVYDEVYIADNHSKVILLHRPPDSGISVVTSQNLTRGNRYESSIISADPSVFNTLFSDFNNIIANHSAPMHEIMNIPSPFSSDSSTTPVDPEKQRIDTIRHLSSIFLPIPDIATILEMPVSKLRLLIADDSSPESLAYRQGKAQAKAKLHAREMQLAEIGSPLGMQHVKDNLLDMESEE